MMDNTGKNSGFWTSWNKVNEGPAVLATFLGYTNKCLGKLEPCPGEKVNDQEADAKNVELNKQAQAQSDAAKQLQDEQAKIEAEIQAKKDLDAKNKNTMDMAIARFKEVDAFTFNLSVTSQKELESIYTKLQNASVFLLNLLTGPGGSLSPIDQATIRTMVNTLKSKMRLLAGHTAPPSED
jgi:hypothetical protein